MPKDEHKPDIDPELVHKLAQILDETGLTEIEYGTQTWHLRVSRTAPVTHAVGVVGTASPAAAGGPTAAGEGGDAPAAEEDPMNHPGLVTSPMVGVVYTLPEPDSPPLTKVGDEVTEGQTLMLIEAMKVYNPIKAARGGRIARIFVSNGAPVEYGEPLLIIE